MEANNLKNTKVREVMSKDLKVAKLFDTMESIEKMLITNNINHIPVVNENGGLLGIVTRNDLELLKDWGTELELVSSKKRNKQLLSSQLVSDRMSEVLSTISPDDTLDACTKLFLDNIFHALPVIENEKLVGIITTYDMLKFAYA